jgi:hypothetical protein
MSISGYNRYEHTCTRGRAHTLSYVTWNKTSFPVPNGSRNLKVIAAIIAQKKLFGRSNIAGLGFPGHTPSPHDLWGKEIRNFLQTEQHATNRRTERNCNTSGGSSTEDLASFTWTNDQITPQGTKSKAIRNERTFVRLILDEESTDDVPNAARDVNERSFLAYKRISATRTSAMSLHAYLAIIPKQQRAQDPRI